MTEVRLAAGTRISDETNGHTVTVTAGVDGYALAIWQGCHRHQAWSLNTTSLDVVLTEARRVRALIETHGSIQAVENLTAQLTSELDIAMRRELHGHKPVRPTAELNRELDQLETPAARQMIQQIGKELAAAQ